MSSTALARAYSPNCWRLVFFAFALDSRTASGRSPGDGVCDTGGTNSQGATECTLRAAIEEANALAGTDTISFNIPTSEPGYSASPLAFTISPVSQLPVLAGTFTIDGTSQPEFSTAGRPVIELNGSSAGLAHGLEIDSNGSVVRGLVINRFQDDGIHISGGGSGNIIAGNYVGTNVTGATGGIYANGVNSISITSGASANIIGGSDPAERNVLGASGGDNVKLGSLGTDDNQIIGNYIGTDVTGTVALGGPDDAIDLGSGPDGTQIIDNLISGGGEDGIDINSSNNTVIQGNLIGVDVTGSAPLGNAREGIEVKGTSANTQIGGTAVGEDNVIGGNVRGIYLYEFTTGAVIQGNSIGVGADGATPVGNTGPGIYIEDSVSNIQIGGTGPGAANEIAYNDPGTQIALGTDITILGNSIHENTGLGIDLTPGGVTGVTANDPGDGDSGPNDLLNFPVITSAVESGGSVTVTFELDTPVGNYRVEFFTNPGGADPSGNGEGETYQAATTVSPGTGLTHSFPGSAGDIITATATEDLGGSYGSTSEFSSAVTVTPNVTVVVNSTGDFSDALPSDGVCDTGGTNSQGATECTLRAAIEDANFAADADTITFNIPTTEPGYSATPLSYTIAPGSGLPVISQTVVIDATTQPDYPGTPIVVVDGSSAGAVDGLSLSADFSEIRGFVVQNFNDDGIQVDGNDNTVAGNYVGVDVTGLSLAGNDDGILVFGDRNTVGGGNVVAGNADDGVSIDGGNDNTVLGNYVGVDAGGLNPIPNGGDGVAIQFGATGNTVGGASRNVISGNSTAGVRVQSAGTTGNFILANYIGVNATGSAAIPNGTHGIHVTDSATATTIGGGAAADRNLISGNTLAGVALDTGATGTVILGNRIGTNSAGLVAIPNGAEGVFVDADNATIGGTRVNDGNLISGNGTDGIRLERLDAVVQGNLIGTDVTGTAPLGNVDDGVDTGSGTAGSLIGGLAAGNTIAYNGGEGIAFRNILGLSGAVVSNSIFGNGGLGIDLAVDGVTANDPGDPDTGPNDLLNFPVITSAVESGGTVTVTFDLDTPAGTYRIEFFSNPSGGDPSGNGEGEIYESATLTTPGTDLTHSFPGSVADIITATATEDVGSNNFVANSEFSAWVVVLDGNPVVNSTGDAPDVLVGDGICNTGATNSLGATECTLRAAIEEANATPGKANVTFNMPVTEIGHAGGIWTITPTSAHPFVTDEVSLDATTQPGFAGTPIVQLDGSLAVGSSAGIVLRTNNSLVRGFIVHSFPDEGLEIDGSTGAGDFNTLVGNWVGIDAAGTPSPNADIGVLITVDAFGNSVGGVAAGDANVIGASTNSGVVIRNTGTDQNVVEGNFIGVLTDGVTPVPNGLHGVEIYDLATDNTIGGIGGAGNTIRYNLGDGVYLAASAGSGNSILSNAIDQNIGLGIDLGVDGVTPNDAGDVDVGPNDLLNFPEITSAVELAGTVTVDFDLEVPAGDYRIEFFVSPAADPSGYGEGATFVAFYDVVGHPGGSVAYSTAFSGSAGDILTATTTEDLGASYGSTSELSAAYTVTPSNSPPVLDPVGDQTIDEETLLTFTATASDVDLPPDTLTFTLQ